MKAYRAVEDWVRAWKVGDEAAPACVAASVTLRMDGEVFGRGVAMGDKCIAAATKLAMAEAEPKFGVVRDALYQDTLKDLAKRVTISVQLAGELVPVTVKDAASAASEIAPGLEGAGARIGDRTAVMFPERMLTMGTEPGAALASLVAKLADDPALAVVPLSMLAKDHGAVYYRFKVSHVAQVKAGDSPRFLQRCGRVVPEAAMDVAELKRWADEMAVELSGGIDIAKGMFDPVRGAAESATPQQRLIIAIALAEYAKTGQISLPQRDRAKWNSTESADSAAAFQAGPGMPDQSISALSAIWASQSLPLTNRGVEPLALIDLLSKSDFVLAKSFDAGANVALDEGASVCGLTAHALVERQMRPVPLKVNPAAYVRQIFAGVAQGQLAAGMPWLGWAEIRIHPTGPVPSAVALREMREQLWTHQLKAEDLPPDQLDLSGGIVFTTLRNPTPSWQMARPLAFVATMLRDPRLTEDKEVSEELLHLLASLRFLRQLTVRESECFMYRKPDQAIGGVRSSLWDQRMPPEATAMTLMAACETLRSLDEIQKRGQKQE